MTKSLQRITAALKGELAYEELTLKELQKLERMIFKAIARKKGAPLLPPTQTRH